MTGGELALCTAAVMSSSLSQLFIKAASSRGARQRLLLLVAATLLLCCSVALVVVALRTLALSRLVSFAAAAYVLVPIGSHFAFNERLQARFWLGTLLIVTGIICTNS